MMRAWLIAAMLAMLAAPAYAATVDAYALPAGFTVKTESETRSITLGAGGVITAIAEPIAAPFHTRAVQWTSRGTRMIFIPLPVLAEPNTRDAVPVDVQALAADGRGNEYITAASSFSGAYSGTSTNVQRLTHSVKALWQLATCVDSGVAQDAHVYGADARGQVALTMDMTGSGSFLVMRDSDEPGAYAPFAFIIDGSRCKPLGRAVVLAVRGQWSSGYRGYLDGHLAPTNLNAIVQRIVAVRWKGTNLDWFCRRCVGDSGPLRVDAR